MIALPTLELPQPAYCTKPLAQSRKAVTSTFVTVGSRIRRPSVDDGQRGGQQH